MAAVDPTPSSTPGTERPSVPPFGDPAKPGPGQVSAQKAPRVATLQGLGGSFPAPTRFSAATRPPKAYRPDALKRRRFLKAYYVTFRVIWSYLWLKLKGRFLGKTYTDREIADVHRLNAKRIERTLLELQGLFIKVGQALSILAGFLPAEFRDELSGMQDQVPPRPFEEIEARIRKEHGKGPHDLYGSFNPIPLASASLGQVHEAYLHDGRRVAVKVQHHGIEEVVRLDLLTIRQIMRIVQWFVPVQGLDNYYREIRALLLEELDFAREAENINRIRANFVRENAEIEVALVDTPEVIPELSTSRVLTLTFVEGVKVGALDELDRLKIDRKELAKQIVHAFCQMIFVDGVYHADPHPGNLLVQRLPDGRSKLILIDFGAVAQLSQPMREGIPEFLEGVLRRDTDRLIKAMRKMGFLGIGSDEAVVEKVIDHFHRKFQEEVKIESLNLKDIKIDPQRGFENLMDLRAMNVGLKELSSSIHVPRDWVLLERTLLLLTGTCTLLDPDMSPMQIVRPYLERFVLGNRDWTQIAIEAVRDTALRAIGLPEAVDNYIKKAVRGELEVKVRGVREGFDSIYSLGRQAMYLATSMAFGGAAMWLHVAHGQTELARLMLWPAGIFGGFFILASLFGRKSRR